MEKERAKNRGIDEAWAAGIWAVEARGCTALEGNASCLWKASSDDKDFAHKKYSEYIILCR